MSRRPRIRPLAAGMRGAAVFMALAGAIVLAPSGQARGLPRRASLLTVGSAIKAPPVASGFIGFSVEYYALLPYTGTNPAAVDPVLLQLIRNLTPGQSPVLRIGGDSTDHSGVPIPGRAAPPGVTDILGPRWLAMAGALARDLRARMIMGINLEANDARLAAAEARAFTAAIGAARVRALELGNEPDLYGSLLWRSVHGVGITGRPAGYDLGAYLRDFHRLARRLPGRLAGPATPGDLFKHQLPQFLASARHLGVVTVHRYPLRRCNAHPGSPTFPSIPNLLALRSSQGLAASAAGAVADARAHGLPLRVDELNSVSCSGQRGVSDTFASALWMLDTLFSMARVGVTGVNIHTLPGATYHPFSLAHGPHGWTGHVFPEYYGLLMFARAAPPGSRLLKVAGPPAGQLRSWATRAPDGRIRIVLINVSARRSRPLALRVPAGAGPASLQWLRARRLGATAGITLAGQGFRAVTHTGLLAPISVSSALAPKRGRYLLELPAASAAMLTIAARR